MKFTYTVLIVICSCCVFTEETRSRQIILVLSPRLVGAEGRDALGVHRLGNGHVDVLSFVKRLANVNAELRVGGVLVGGHEVLAVLSSVLVQEGGEAILGDISQQVHVGTDDGGLHVVGRGGNLFVLLASEDVNSSNVGLGVSVLAGLRGGHLDNLAREALQQNDLALLDLTSADRLGLGGIGSCLQVVSAITIMLSRHDLAVCRGRSAE